MVQAIKKEIERCGIAVDTAEKSLRRNFFHAGSDLHGAIVHANGAFKVTDCIPRSQLSHDDFVYDVTIDAVVRGTGIWTGKRQPLEDKTFTWKHNALQNAEAQKYKKYEEGYANLSIGFLAFALSCFGVLADSLVRFFFVLATVESKVLNQRRQQGVPLLLDGEDLSSVTAHNFQSSRKGLSGRPLPTGKPVTPALLVSRLRPCEPRPLD